jgi:hypothetical protein
MGNKREREDRQVMADILENWLKMRLTGRGWLSCSVAIFPSHLQALSVSSHVSISIPDLCPPFPQPLFTAMVKLSVNPDDPPAQTSATTEPV